MGDQQTKTAADVAQAYRDVFLYTPQGRMILLDLIRTSGLLTIAGLRDDNDLQHMSGSQDMVRRIMSIASVDEARLLQLATTGDIDDE